MSKNLPRDEDEVRWLAWQGHAGAASSPCPDENELVGWAEQRLDARRAEAVEAHLADCDACREVAFVWRETVAAKDETTPAEEQTGALRFVPGGRLSRWVPFAVAAAILIAIGVRIAGRETHVPTSGDSRLVAAARDLSRAHPDLLAGFAPVSASEREAVLDDRPRAGISIVEPVGLLLDVPSKVSWTAPPDDTEVRLVVVDAQGETLGSVSSRGKSVEMPGRARMEAGGRYVLEVTGDGALGSSTLRRSFAVATNDARATWGKAAAAIRAEAPPELAEVLVAHAAARRGLLVEAFRVAEARAAANPDDAEASAIREYARKRLRSGDTGP